MARKQRICRICRKRPVWTHADVKDPGPVCKRCYHRHVWPDRNARTRASDPTGSAGPSSGPVSGKDDIPCSDPPPP